MRSSMRILAVAVALLVRLGAQQGQAPVVYTVSFPAPEHHQATVEVTFSNVPAGTLEARMSRSSPGRYAVHEFAKNVFDVQAFDGTGKALTVTRPNPYQWDVTGHDGTVRIVYRIFGDLVDGTYLGIDSTHAHMNMPATLMWARGMDNRPSRITFTPPAGSAWKPATQLFPTADPWTFTAPNLQYLLDSPTELSAYTLREFKVANPDGKSYTIRSAIHTESSAGDIDQYAAGVEKIVKEMVTVFGEYPEFDTGTYTFLADYLPTNGGDGMEHRNSTVVSGRGNVRFGLGTVSHEFFHAWNVERIRPQGLEPFNYEEANLTDSLWVAEGFTQYYGSLIMGRAGLSDVKRTVSGMGSTADSVVNGSGRQFRSPVEMSHNAPFTDAARAVDPTNFSVTFISYYTYGAGVALGLDLALRDKTNGKVTLDDFMRAMWKVHGKPGGPQPGLVAKPVLARRHPRSPRRGFGRSRVRRRLLPPLHDRPRSRGLRAADAARRRRPAQTERRPRLGRRAEPGQRRTDRQPAGSGHARLRRGPRTGRSDHRSGRQGRDLAAANAGSGRVTEARRQRRRRVQTPQRRRADDEDHVEEDPGLEAVLLEDTGGTPTPAQKAFAPPGWDRNAGRAGSQGGSRAAHVRHHDMSTMRCLDGRPHADEYLARPRRLLAIERRERAGHGVGGHHPAARRYPTRAAAAGSSSRRR